MESRNLFHLLTGFDYCLWVFTILHFNTFTLYFTFTICDFLQFAKFLNQKPGKRTFMQFESRNTCIRNTAHQNRTKRLHSIPVDLPMPRAHTSELDRLRLCQCTAADLRGFHLQSPPFLCMLMCLCTQWRQGCTWQSMCVVVWISVRRRMNTCTCVNKCTAGAHGSLNLLIILLSFSSIERLQALFGFLFLARPPPSWCLFFIFFYHPH